MPSVYISSLSSAKSFAKHMKFATIREYSKYVEENNLPYKVNPSEYKGYVSASDFLGMTPIEYRASKSKAQITNRDQGAINQKISVFWANKRASREAKAEAIQTRLPLAETPKVVGLDPDMLISYLIDVEVEPQIIVRLIADLEISSGSMMAELCKYMTKRTLEKQASWRPTGYSTAEAQMSTKI
jgi:hypothetical protein